MSDLPPALAALADRIRNVTGGNRRYKVSGGHEFAELAALSPTERAAFAQAAGCQVVSRLGGSVFEFTRAGALRP